MSMPGWYPDPAGGPGRFRYWDGATWSSETTTNPSQATRPASLAAAGQPEEQKGGKGLLVALAGLLVLALVIWAAFFRGGGDDFVEVPEDTNSASPTGPVWNETEPVDQPSDIHEPAPNGGAMVDCPTGGGSTTSVQGNELHGGGLVIPALDGWSDASSQRFTLPWTHDLQAQTRVIHQSFVNTWFSVQAVGALPRQDGFTEPRNSARMMMSCFATSDYYSGFTGRKDLVSQKVDVDGRPGWWLRSEVYVEMEELPQVAGDTIDVVVVDTGDPAMMGTFVSSATIGDEPVLDAVSASREALRLG